MRVCDVNRVGYVNTRKIGGVCSVSSDGVFASELTGPRNPPTVTFRTGNERSSTVQDMNIANKIHQD